MNEPFYLTEANTKRGHFQMESQEIKLAIPVD